MHATRPTNSLRLLIPIAAAALLAALLLLPAPVRAQDTTAPELLVARVSGTSLVLVYDEALDTSSIPAASAYSVGFDPGTSPTLTGVGISGARVTLTLSTAATSADAVTVTYVVPTTGNKLQDLAAVTPNEATALSAHVVTNNTGATNPQPVFSSATTTYNVAENTGNGMNVGSTPSITGTDSDTLTYALDGPDASSFTIVTTSGQIQTSAALDFETKPSYSVVVSVRDSKNAAGDPETDTVVDDAIAVTITVTNVDEAGMASFTGDLSGGSTLTALVTDPDGSIGSKSYRWQRSTMENSGFSNIPSGATSETYTLVAADVGEYLKVVVSYMDGQGAGKSATSDSRGPIGASNSEPTFSSMTAMRSVVENPTTVTNVGNAVTATDSDSGHTLTYAFKSGGDRNFFDIDTSSGQIKTKTGTMYNFEATKNSYTVTVTVHDGKDAAGDASSTVDAEIMVTINLTNVDEAGTASFMGTLSGGVDADGVGDRPGWGHHRQDVPVVAGGHGIRGLRKL